MGVKSTIPNADFNKPTKVRWKIFYMLLVMTTVNYIDRSVLSVAMPYIQEDLNLDSSVVGIILSTFFWGYAIMQIPSGWVADKIQPYKLIAGGGMIWGIVQIFTGMVNGSKLLMFLRVILGVSEAPMMPSGAKLQSVWLSPKERGRGATLLDSGAPLGTAIGGPIMTAFLIWFGGWRGALVAVGILTMIVSLIAWKVIKGKPETKKGVNDAEREHILKSLEEENKSEDNNGLAKASVKDYLKFRNFWLMCLGWFSFNTVFYGLMTWGPFYLVEAHGMEITTTGTSFLVIFGFGFIGELTGGWVSDKWKSKGGDPNIVMRTLLTIAGVFTSIAILLLSTAQSELMAVSFMSVALFFLRWGGLYWSIPSTIAQREHVGIVGGSMNFAGNIAGVVTPIYIGVIVSVTGTYFLGLMAFAVAGILLAASSILINYKRKVII